MARGKKNTGEDPARTEETIKLGPDEEYEIEATTPEDVVEEQGSETGEDPVDQKNENKEAETSDSQPQDEKPSEKKKDDTSEEQNVKASETSGTQLQSEKQSDGILCTIEGFADLTYGGVKYKRGDKVLLKETHYKKFQRWVKKV